MFGNHSMTDKVNNHLMKKAFLIFTISGFMIACSEQSAKVADMSTTTDTSFTIAGKQVVVYTTADSTNLRLTATDTLSFADFDQPFETQPSIFVDPSHRFQTFLGIGGALT